MAVNIGWVWKATDTLTLTTGNLIGFYGINYGDPIKIGEFNKSTRIRKSVNEDVEIGSTTPFYNYAYISDQEASINGMTPTRLSSSNPQAGHSLMVQLIDTGNMWAFKVLQVRVFAFSGSDMTVPAAGVEIYMFEVGQNTWHRLYGSSNPSYLTTRMTPGTRHVWEIGLSIRPLQVVDKTCTIRLEADIQ